MVRGDELRVRVERGDTLIAGRSVEQLTQYYRGLRVWGGSVAREFDGHNLVSVFGTIYQGLDLDVAPAMSRDAARAALEAQEARCCSQTPNQSWSSCQQDGGTSELAWIGAGHAATRHRPLLHQRHRRTDHQALQRASDARPPTPRSATALACSATRKR